MRAAILAIGSELLGTERLDTNSLRLARVLAKYGVELVGKRVIGDSESAIAAEIRQLLDEHDLLLVTGGLGPTSDDVTREAASAATGCELERHPDLEAHLEAWFARWNRPMADVNRKQADVPRGATVLNNPRGTAPGLRWRDPATDATIFLFPGVPTELDGMIDCDLEPWLEAKTDGGGLESAVVKVACVGESDLEERIAPAYSEFGRESISVLAKPAEVAVEVSARGSIEERRTRLGTMQTRLVELIGSAVFSTRADEDLETVVGDHLARLGQTVATAESCTGGLIAERLTRVAGSSRYFLGAAVTYSNEAKSSLLGVSESTLEEHGAVSEVVAREMAAGARQLLGSDWGIGVTGIAGPGGGSPEKPVGTVHVAWAAPNGEVEHRRLQLLGSRDRIRRMTSQIALEMLRRRLVAGSTSVGSVEPVDSVDPEGASARQSEAST